MGIFEDKLRREFGFPTKKESLDVNIDSYRQNDKNKLEHSKALRAPAISYLDEQIRQIESIINNNQFLIDTYEKIESLALEKIKVGDSPLQSKIFDNNGTIIVKGNVKIINDFYQSLMKKGTDYLTLEYYSKQMASVIKSTWLFYANKIIEGKGALIYNNREIDTCYDIYSGYMQCLNLMNSGRLKNEFRKSFKVNATNMQLMTSLYNYCSRVNNILSITIQDLQNKKSILISEQASENYVLETIEQTKKIMQSSSAYVAAKASHDYLEEIDKLKR